MAAVLLSINKDIHGSQVQRSFFESLTRASLLLLLILAMLADAHSIHRPKLAVGRELAVYSSKNT
ncbi:MAG: hypothetical protein AAFX54_04915 [Pseudomonadota bacterium]